MSAFLFCTWAILQSNNEEQFPYSWACQDCTSSRFVLQACGTITIYFPQNLQVHLDEPVIGAGEENISGKNSALDVIGVLVAVRGNSRDLIKVCLILRSLLSCLFLGSLPLTTNVIFRRNS